jgi:hypothetical protein
MHDNRIPEGIRSWPEFEPRSQEIFSLTEMRTISGSQFFRVSMPLAISCAIVVCAFLWQGHDGFNLYDEGFLWYGAQRVLVGDVPVRDFMSYDPGRYYWSAALMGAMRDDGLIALRIAVAVFEAAGLWLALSLLQTGRRIDPALLVLAAIAFFVWMYPGHKLFDITLSIALISVTALLIRAPRRRTFFIAGVVLGVVAVFGKNHGVYGVCGLAGGMVYLACLRGKMAGWLMESSMLLATGVFVGYLPVLLMIAFVPGFALEFWAGIRFLFESGSTNLSLPVPWPWLAPFATALLTDSADAAAMGVIFIAMAAFAVGGPVWALRRATQLRPADPTLVSCALLALPYAHFAFSRADIEHLAQGIFPLLIACFAILGSRTAAIRWPLAIVIAATSLWVMLPRQPGWACAVKLVCVETNVAGEFLSTRSDDANYLEVINALAGQYSPNGRSFVVTPLWPGAYAALRRKSPMWEIYALFPRSEDFQKREIERIRQASPGFVFVVDYAYDRQDSLRFRNTHSLMDRFFRENFERLSDADIDKLPASARNPSFQLYKLP